MKSFKEYLIENDTEILRSTLNLGKEYTFLYKDTWVIDTFHKLDRVEKRGSNKGQTNLFKKAIDWLLKTKKSKEYLFVSKSSRLGMVVDYRKDKMKKVKGNHLIIITWLGDVTKKLKKSPDEVFAKKGTEKVLLEDLGIDSNNIQLIYVQ